LDEALGQARRSRSSTAGPGEEPPTGDPEVQKLTRRADALGTAPQLEVDPHFANRLERRVLAQHRTLAHPARDWWGSRFLQPIRTRPALTASLCLCLLVALLSSGVL